MTKVYKIKDFLKRIKNTIIIEDGILYKRVTVSGNHKGVSLRDEVDGSKIGTKKQFTISGNDFILSKIDARNGAFGIIPKNLEGAIITGNFWTYKVDTEIVDTEWFFYFTHSFNFIQICIESSTGSTHRKYLDEKVFLQHEISLPKKSVQVDMVKKYKEQSKLSTNLKKEIKFQKTILLKLKQSILQEGIEGKLTNDWRTNNPEIESSYELLKRIREEKYQLIKNKKIKKEKPLAEISKQEIPFELPAKWVWCRLGEVMVNSDNLNIQKIYSPNKIINYVDIDAINNKTQKIKAPKIEPVSNLSSRARRVLKKGNIMYSLVRPYLHNLAIVEEEKEDYIGSTGFAVFDCLLIENKYIFWLLLSKYIEKLYLGFMDGFNSPSITHDQFKNTLIPLPPHEEQIEIIKKIEILNTKCISLSKEIENSESNAKKLIQAVLKEAFENKDIKKTKVVAIQTKPTNIDYYKRTLLATEIVWQLQKEPTLGHLKLQKLIYLAQESSTMQLPTNFLQQVAGPYDPKMARSLDKQMKTKKWFEYKKTELLKFKPLEKAGEHKTDFEKFFANEKESILYIIDTFKTAKSDSIELVGTLYACWKKLTEEKQMITDELISKRFYEWSEEKAKFEKSRILKALRWMETKGIVPEKANA